MKVCNVRQFTFLATVALNFTHPCTSVKSCGFARSIMLASLFLFPLFYCSATRICWLEEEIIIKMAIYCPRGSGMLRQQLLMIHWLCQSMPEQARVCQVCQSMQEYARVCQSMQEYVRVCQGMQEYARVWQSMPEYARVCQSMQEYIIVCQSMPEYARVCQSIPKYARVCRNM